MKFLLTLLSLVAVTLAQEDRVRCMTGSRLQVEGFTVFDTAISSFCAPEKSFCTRYTYNQVVVDNGTPYTLAGEFGECSEFEVDNCDTILPFLEPVGEVSNCSATSCEARGDACNEFEFQASPSDCSVPEGDVAAFPGCSMKTAIEGVFECATPFINNFPYDEENQCNDNLNQMISCFGEKIAQCVDSNCPSIFDSISGFRSQFSEISYWAANIRTSDALVQLVGNYTGGEFNMQEIIDNYMCSVNRSEVFGLIQQLEDSRVDIEGLISGLFPAFNCPDVFSNLQNAGFEFLRDFYNAQNQREVARAMTQSVNRISRVFQDCDLGPVLAQAGNVLDSVNFTLADEQLLTAFNVIREFATFLPTPQPEGCPAEGPGRFGQVRLNCDRYYNLTSRCGRRKSWACNFAEWRFNFLRTWLNEFYDKYGDEALPTPTCGNDADFVRCRNSDLCCYEAPRGCRICYCTEHDYENSDQDIYQSWRASYRDWSAFFQAYQRFSRNSDTCF